ncbi:PDDEXK family nuclease [Wolbachia endosymbiont of Litomosoides brasiliensis]|uniref:hypothetical protein n=1 Tax=Wolbachia endosymbiont of Litomosoides brasiliensis TaxID=1812117 RepID=UPI001FE7B112|nr:hypothetical protein [Wolbachia endosymbiont of Litomosoides brasiliensis]
MKLKYCNVIKHRCKFGEVDLIVSKKKELIFIEVEISLLGEGVAISHLQCQSIINSSKCFLSKDLGFLGCSIRCNLYLFLKGGPICIKNAWFKE